MGDLFLSGLPLLLNAADGAGHGRKFDLLAVDPGLIFWTVLTFVCLLLLLRKTAWGPIIEGLDRREESIRNSINEAERANEEGKKLLEQQQAELATARQEAQKIIEKGTVAAKAMRDDIIAKAQSEAGDLLEAARHEIQLETGKARDALRKDIVGLSLDIAGKVLERSLDDSDHERLAKEFMAQADRIQ
ncbi:MAG: F0F1 ATP synthase subunit B [bacterium]|nr:F0F1 ATP synthase subunit B [bacterium]